MPALMRTSKAPNPLWNVGWQGARMTRVRRESRMQSSASPLTQQTPRASNPPMLPYVLLRRDGRTARLHASEDGVVAWRAALCRSARLYRPPVCSPRRARAHETRPACGNASLVPVTHAGPAYEPVAPPRRRARRRPGPLGMLEKQRGLLDLLEKQRAPRPA